ncbi:hypothetical protein Htur_4916 (plasmid) [Haloterrigena turkmenica DSM 5511]|uniref:Uncharacterized protein n=1 Tax=Haloterrigena turkmenica (strain ATCC 51198 / DSM 5511 / JCM 9101 / NCIMB 13204 / VKM B-1734 / 4k) TaxID=543526 RepID=D2S2Q6_HALTV|nr:hypothetical protein Htur_4916 [Haloterrigena turkmenica DSM 5511]
MDRARLSSSVQYLNIGIRTSWTSDCFRTLEFAALSLGLPFEGNCPTTAVASPVVDDIVVSNREPLATVAHLLEHQSTAS